MKIDMRLFRIGGIITGIEPDVLKGVTHITITVPFTSRRPDIGCNADIRFFADFIEEDDEENEVKT